jgi:hypothetical protein
MLFSIYDVAPENIMPPTIMPVYSDRGIIGNVTGMLISNLMFSLSPSIITVGRQLPAVIKLAKAPHVKLATVEIMIVEMQDTDLAISLL